MANANVASPPNDPNVVLPPAVLAQIARSEQIISQVYKSQPSADGDGEAGDGESGADASGDVSGTPVADTNEPPASEAPKAPTKKVTPPGNDDRAQLAAMNGRYNRALQDLDIARGELAALRNRLDQLERENAALRAAEASAPIPNDVEFTPEEIEEYGEEFLSLVGKKAAQIVAPVRAEFDRKLANISAKVETTQTTVARTAQQELVDTLRSQFPQFDDLNTDPQFLSWLGLPDPISGVIRQEHLNDAVAKLNTARCAAIIKGYLEEQASSSPAGVTQTTGKQVEPAKTPKVDLAALAGPGRAKTAPVTDTADKPIITRAEIAQFYADVAQGKYPKEEVVRIESVINSAMKEGRIK